jgi:hypothetical protein
MLVSADDAGVGVDARGNATAVWVEGRSDATTGFKSEYTIYAASARAGSKRWSAPTALDGPGALTVPVIAVSPSGVAVAAWLQWVSGGVFTGENNEVFAAIRSARGLWGRAASLGSEYEPPFEQPTTNAPGPRVAIDAAGTAIVVWQHRAGPKVLPEADVLDLRAMRWGRPKAVAGSDAIDPAVALDAAGDATVAWTSADNGVVISNRRLTRGCSWTRPQTLLKTQVHTPFPQIAANPGGAGIIVWQGPVRATTRSSPASPWQRPVTLSSTIGGEAQAALDPKGDAVVAWEQPGPPYKYEVVRAARYVAERQTVKPKALPCR